MYIRNISNIKYNNNNSNNNHHHQQQKILFFLFILLFFVVSFNFLFLSCDSLCCELYTSFELLHVLFSISNSSLSSHVHLKRNAGKKEPTYTSILPVLIEFHKLNCMLVEKSKRGVSITLSCIVVLNRRQWGY